MGWVVSGLNGWVVSGLGETVHEMTDAELAAACQASQEGITGQVVSIVSDSIQNSPCVELAIRNKIRTTGKQYGVPLILGVIGLGVLGGLISRQLWR